MIIIDRLQYKIAQLSNEESIQWTKKHNIAAAIGIGIATRVISAAMTVFQALCLVTAPFIMLTQVGIFWIRSRNKPLHHFQFSNFVKTQINGLKALATGLALSMGSILLSEVFYNILKIQKTFFNFTIKINILSAQKPGEEILKRWIFITQGLNIRYETASDLERFLRTFLSTWQEYAMLENEMSDIGSSKVNNSFSESIFNAKVKYITDEMAKLPKDIRKMTRAHHLVALPELYRNTARTLNEQEGFEILSALYPKPLAVLKKPSPVVITNSNFTDPDSERLIATLVNNDVRIADDAQVADRLQLRELILWQRNNVEIINDNIFQNVENNEQQALKRAREASFAESINGKPTKERSETEVKFSKLLLQHMKKAHLELVKKKLFDSADIEQMDEKAYLAVVRLGIFKLLSSKTILIWKNEKIKDIETLQQGLKTDISKIEKDSTALEYLYARFSELKKTPEIEKKLTELKRKNQATAKLVEAIFNNIEKLRDYIDRNLVNNMNVKNAVPWYEAFDPTKL